MMDLATKPPATVRLVIACCAADPAGPLDVRQKALLWQKLHDATWVPSADTMPSLVPLPLVQAWLDGLQSVVKVFVEGLDIPAEENAS